MVDAADQQGTAALPETVHGLGKESLFGDAISLGAVSFYDFLKKENADKKVFVCNGSACLCAGTQDKLHHTLEGHFEKKEIGHICCLGRCHEGGALQYQGRNYSGQSDTALETLFLTGEGDGADRYAVVSLLQPAQLTAPFPGIEPITRRSGNYWARTATGCVRIERLRVAWPRRRGIPAAFQVVVLPRCGRSGKIHRLQCG